jgi:hypothetical protein
MALEHRCLEPIALTRAIGTPLPAEMRKLEALSEPAVSHQASNKCRPRGALPKAMIAVRKKFETQCGEPPNQWRPLGAVAYVSSVGFFDITHSQNPRGMMGAHTSA